MYSAISIHCLTMGDEFLLKHSLDQYQRFVTINGIYHVKYIENNLDKLNRYGY